jgi:hypothetical protein
MIWANRFGSVRGFSVACGMATLLLATAVFCDGPSMASGVKLPLIGCPSDGQVGPEAAPRSGEISLSINPDAASRLAYYTDKSEVGGMSVLAPRGWHCFGVYGSNGESLFVAREAISTGQFFKGDWKGIAGPAIQFSFSDGGTSGRFEVAEIVSKIFPQEKAFVESVIAEGLEKTLDYSFGPFPGDRLKRIGKNIVEYETPPGVKGLGIQTRLIPNSDSIMGVVILNADNDNSIHQLAVRLPKDQADLATTIVRQTESR